MEIASTALFLGAKQLGESQSIAHFFSADYGLVSGVHSLSSRQKRSGGYIIGEHVQLKWRARLQEHLGRVTFERDSHQYCYALCLSGRVNQALLCMSGLLKESLVEQNPEVELYHQTTHLLSHFSQSKWLGYYLKWEEFLLASLGFSLDYSCCGAGCTRQDLQYLSPKTGKAICADHGMPYADRLWALPGCWKQERGHEHYNEQEDLLNALDITGFFLARELLSPKSVVPALRRNFLDKMQKKP